MATKRKKLKSELEFEEAERREAKSDPYKGMQKAFNAADAKNKKLNSIRQHPDDVGPKEGSRQGSSKVRKLTAAEERENAKKMARIKPRMTKQARDDVKGAMKAAPKKSNLVHGDGSAAELRAKLDAIINRNKGADRAGRAAGSVAGSLPGGFQRRPDGTIVKRTKKKRGGAS